MEFTATTNDLAIDYRLTEKIYGANEGTIKAKLAANPNLLITKDPFDTETILKGNTWVLPANAEWHRERVLST